MNGLGNTADAEQRYISNTRRGEETEVSYRTAILDPDKKEDAIKGGTIQQWLTNGWIVISQATNSLVHFCSSSKRRAHQGVSRQQQIFMSAFQGRGMKPLYIHRCFSSLVRYSICLCAKTDEQGLAQDSTVHTRQWLTGWVSDYIVCTHPRINRMVIYIPLESTETSWARAKGWALHIIAYEVIRTVICAGQMFSPHRCWLWQI